MEGEGEEKGHEEAEAEEAEAEAVEAAVGQTIFSPSPDRSLRAQLIASKGEEGCEDSKDIISTL